MKSEPDAFSIDDLKKRKHQTEHWDGVRNYQVRNLLRDEIRKGDLALFYHSSCKVPAAVGIVTISSDGYPDHTALDPESKYYDPKSTPDQPRWYMVDVTYLKSFATPVTLQAMKQQPELLNSDFALLKRGSRLSIMPVSKLQWDTILNMAAAKQE